MGAGTISRISHMPLPLIGTREDALMTLAGRSTTVMTPRSAWMQEQIRFIEKLKAEGRDTELAERLLTTYREFLDALTD